MRKWIALTTLAGGALFQAGCSLTDAIFQTIFLGLEIADVWV